MARRRRAKDHLTARDWPTRLGLVAAGLGIALVPGIAVRAVPRGVRWIPVHDDTGGSGGRLAATNDNPSAAATAMVHALEEEVSPSAPSAQATARTAMQRTVHAERAIGAPAYPLPAQLRYRS